MSSKSSVSPISPLSPVSPMSPPPQVSVRPPHLVLNQHSSSLSGMEIAVPSPLTPGFQVTRTWKSKALPPTPRKASVPYHGSHSAPTSRKASSTYSEPDEERPGTSMSMKKELSTNIYFGEKRPRTPRSALQNELLSSKTLLIPPEGRSSTSKIPDKVSLRPQLTRDARTLGESDFTAREQSSGSSIFTEWKAPKYEYSDDEYSSSSPTSRKASSRGSWAPPEQNQSAEERAKEYTSVLPAFVLEPIPSESDLLQSEMSARIIDVFDGTLMPAPLVLSGNSEDRKLSSQFSDDDDSEIESLLGDSKPSLKTRAKKAFNSRKALQERKEKSCTDSKTSQYNPTNDLGTAKRASLQNGIDEMYSTLTGLYSPSKPKSKHDSINSTNSPRRPGTPLSGDMRAPRQAWDSLKSPKSPAPKRDESVGKKLASVLQNGVKLDRGREQKMKNEE